MNAFYTYTYFDPLVDVVIYVGKGQDMSAWRHRNKKTRLGYTIRKRLSQGIILEPKIEYHKNENTALAAEIFWIATYGREDLGKGSLFNLTNGGEGTSGRKISIDEISKRVITRKLKGPWNTPETNRKISNTKKCAPSYIRSPETLEKNSSWQRGEKSRMYGSKNPPGCFQPGRTPWNKGVERNTPSPLANIPQLSVICPHCGKEGGNSVMKRHHFDRCKNKPILSGYVALQ